jgi:large subunit ribosomal protein L18
MSKKASKNQRRLKIHSRIRQKISGTDVRPRVAVFRSLRHFYAQVIDDSKGATLLAVTTQKDRKTKRTSSVEAARNLGKELGEEAKKKGIETIVFDRGGYLYHGRVQAFAEAAREAGLKF